jgi:hypothetical protein
VVGSVTQDSTSKPSGQSNPKVTPTITTQNTSPPATTPGKTFEINTVQSTTTGKSQQPRSKKKGKGKAKKNSPQQEKPKTQPVEDTQKCKPKYPCLICEEEHYTKDCPRHADVNHFLKGTSTTPVILKNPFPSQ